MASQTVNVARYTALVLGISYGIFHQATMQTRYDEKKAANAQTHRQHLIEQGRAAFAKKKAEEAAGVSAKKGTGLITDPEDPKFDLEKLVNSWAESS